MVYETMDLLLESSRDQPVGMLAYAMDRELIFLRVKEGWRFIQVGQNGYGPGK